MHWHSGFATDFRQEACHRYESPDDADDMRFKVVPRFNNVAFQALLYAPRATPIVAIADDFSMIMTYYFAASRDALRAWRYKKGT